MDIDVYCDESHPDLFTSKKPRVKYLVIGSLWLPSQNRNEYKASIHTMRDTHKIGGEFKWTKVSPSKIDFYKDLVSWFCSRGSNLRFRCIAVDHRQIDLHEFHESDQELGFYKFYYQTLHHWIFDFNSYSIFCDYKRNRRRDRLHVLQSCLKYSNLSSDIKTLQAIRSRESVLMQLTDVLVGIAGARLNNGIRENTAKHELLLCTERLLNRKIAPTPRSEKKFNVFRINLQGGW